MEHEILLDVRHLTHIFPLSRKTAVKAVDDVSFQIRRGEIFGLVGESGSGKSTAARCVMNIYQPYAGQIYYKGIDTCDRGQFRKNKKMLQTTRQMIFQDSGSSLNQRMKVRDIIEEPMRVQKIRPLRGSGLKNDALLETFYDILIEGLQIHGAYAIYMFYDRYDIPAKASDKERLGESEEMFPYLICAVCPLVGEYEPGNPICGFLFPAFVDRSGDLERVDIYAERAAWGDRMASILGAKGRKFRCGL